MQFVAEADQPSVFNLSKHKSRDGLIYYILPENYFMYKAHRTSNARLYPGPGNPHFFGFKNTEGEYIRDYEKEYGIIKEYRTTRKYKLLAFDHPTTQKSLYAKAPSNIKKIMTRNYGIMGSGIRNSVSEKDRLLSRFICDLGYDGYATNTMNTDFGYFHPEMMICNVDGIELVGQITTEEREQALLEEFRMKKLAEEMESARKRKKTNSVFGFVPDENVDNNMQLVMDENMFSPNQEGMFPSPPRGGLFASDEFNTPPRPPPPPVFNTPPKYSYLSPPRGQLFRGGKKTRKNRATRRRRTRSRK